jgi:hypothetical protein
VKPSPTAANSSVESCDPLSEAGALRASRRWKEGKCSRAAGEISTKAVKAAAARRRGFMSVATFA